MNRLIERCAMLDVHKAQITACVRVPDGDGGRRQEIQEFRAWLMEEARATSERGKAGNAQSPRAKPPRAKSARRPAPAGPTPPATKLKTLPPPRARAAVRAASRRS